MNEQDKINSIIQKLSSRIADLEVQNAFLRTQIEELSSGIEEKEDEQDG